ncbi:MAG TPA: sulfotransferase [Amaricoccus sp.]|nr:sulfotransferase [Amaricoccus sp.]
MPAVRHVFIVTSGRTGSTLLLGMLNAHPGVHLRGENYGFVYYQYKAVEALRLSLGHLGGQAGVSPFMGADEVDVPDFERRIGETCRGFVDAGCGADTRLRGFKEVRYDMPDLDDYLDFLDRTFTAAFFVFLVRDAAEVGASGFWKALPAERAAARVAAMQRRFGELAQARPGTSAVIDYADLVRPGAALRHLFDRLGIGWDRDRIEEVLAAPHSYDQRSVVFHDNTRLQVVSRVELERRLAWFHFDRPAPGPGGATLVAGAMLPHPHLPAISGIFAVPGHLGPDAEQAQVAGELGLPSPGVQRRFPEHPGSAAARFRLAVDPGCDVADIFLRLEGETLRLGRLTVHRGDTRGFMDPSVGFDGVLRT